MSILYFEIVNLKTKSIIGSYTLPEILNSSIKEEIERKSAELRNKYSPGNGAEKDVFNFKTFQDKKIDLYFSITSSDILYLTFVEILSFYFENMKDSSIYELFELIDGQGIKKNVDKSGKLTLVGQQNLKFSIEKYQNTYFSNSGGGGGLIEGDPHDNKIAVINSQINDVKNDMAVNVKNMISNAQAMNEIEGKSVKIKDTSFEFSKNSRALEGKMRKNMIRNRIILVVAVACVIGLIIYLIVK